MKRLLTSDPLTGTKTYFHKDPVTGKVTFQDVQDITQIIERNKAIQNDGTGGWSKSRELRYAATVPNVTLLEWSNETGVPMNSKEFGEVVKKKLNDPDNRAFRTGVFKL